MTLEATLKQGCDDVFDYTAETALTAGQVIQLADGRAGVPNSDIAAGDLRAVQTEGLFSVLKTANVVFLDGCDVFFNKTTRKCHMKRITSSDFYIGSAFGDAAASDAAALVALNRRAFYVLDALNGPGDSVAVGTVAAGGFDIPKPQGGALSMSLTATNEAQKADLLSVDRVDVSANGIFEAAIRLENNGSTNAVDLSVGVANASHASDADSITNHVLFHVDGGDLSVFLQSKDGTTTVTATDTTVDLTAGKAVANRAEFWLDMRDPANVKAYIDGVRVLSGTTFVLTAAAGPLGVLAHLEKTSGTATAGPVHVDKLRLRTAQK